MTTLFQPLDVAPTFSLWRGHCVASYCAGTGSPLLLLHSINAAASAFEMRGPFVGLRDRFRVHALDLLGYGCSDRPVRRYDAADYIAIIGHFLQQINAPTSIIASSLSAAYAVAAAAQWPSLVQSLVLVCPTGISQLAHPAGPVERGVYRLLRGPLGMALFQALTSQQGTRFFLERQAYADPTKVTPDVVAGFYQASHQPGALYAPICFLSNLLNCDIADTFAQLTIPILLVWGREATTTPLAKADEFLVRNRRARLAVIERGSLMVQDEHPAEFNALVAEFLG